MTAATSSTSATPPTTERRGWASSLVRASGVLLAVLVTLHLLDTYVLHDVGSTTAKTFSDRWSTPVWRALDWALVVLALVHGVIGLRPVIERGVGRPWLRGLVSAVLYAAVAVLIALVTFVALTFEFF
jgi:succinate dehydrogenase / fumarate reductase membrane anchor subunit